MFLQSALLHFRTSMHTDLFVLDVFTLMGGSNNSDKLICALSCVYFFFQNMGCGSAKITSKLASSLSPCTIFG